MSATLGAGRDQAEIGMTDRGGGRGAEAGRGVDDRELEAAVGQHVQARRDVGGVIDRLDHEILGGATALPVGQGALRVGLDQADGEAGLLGRQREADGERALATATLLGGQYDRVHGKINPLECLGQEYATRTCIASGC
ncbi:hypothetical protein ACVMGE_003672 [Bradyrhizobium diazoefficiens]